MGQDGIAYTGADNYYGQAFAKQAVDERTRQATWSLLANLSWLAASPDGGAMVQNASLQLAWFDGTGQPLETYESSLVDPVQQNASCIAVAGLVLRSYVGAFLDATRFDATYGNLTPAARRGFGNAQRSSAQSKPGVGLFVKTHNVVAMLGVEFDHASIKIVPTNQQWLLDRPTLIGGTDEFGNKYFTIGAGTGEGDTSSTCTGTLTKVTCPVFFGPPET